MSPYLNVVKKYNIYYRLLVILVFPIWLCHFPICFVSCEYFIIKSARSGCFLLQMGWLKNKRRSNILHRDSFSPSPLVLLHFHDFLYLQIASWTCVLELAIFWLPSLSSHIHHSALICMWACVSLGVPDNLSEVLLKLMRGDSIGLQTPLINLSRSTCTMHANELFKYVTGAVPSCLNSIEDWILNWTERTMKKSPVSSRVSTGSGQFPARVAENLTSKDLKVFGQPTSCVHSLTTN